jgi:hypothetical protein
MSEERFRLRTTTRLSSSKVTGPSSVPTPTPTTTTTANKQQHQPVVDSSSHASKRPRLGTSPPRTRKSSVSNHHDQPQHQAHVITEVANDTSYVIGEEKEQAQSETTTTTTTTTTTPTVPQTRVSTRLRKHSARYTNFELDTALSSRQRRSAPVLVPPPPPTTSSRIAANANNAKIATVTPQTYSIISIRAPAASPTKKSTSGVTGSGAHTNQWLNNLGIDGVFCFC